jgi:hypothetical protein
MTGDRAHQQNRAPSGVNPETVTSGSFGAGPFSFSPQGVDNAGEAARMLKDWLQRSGQSQRALGRFLGLDDSAISRVFKGERELSADEFLRALRFVVRARA